MSSQTSANADAVFYIFAMLPYPSLNPIAQTTMMPRAISILRRAVFGSEPNKIGMGPIITTAPNRIFLPLASSSTSSR